MKMFEPAPGIKVYDDVFDYNQSSIIYEQCLDNEYQIGWKDTLFSEDQFLYSNWGSEHWQTAMLSQNLQHFLCVLGMSEPFVEHIQDKIIKRSVINCGTVADSMSVHTHLGEGVMLYYANLEWKPEWSGETFFYDKSGKNIIYTSPYTPNRMILFNGEMPHRFNSPSRLAPKYRFTVSTFFEGVTDLENTPDSPKEEQPEEKPKTSENKPEISLRNIL